MDLKTLGLAIFIAAAYVAWPNAAKPLGIKPGLVPFVVIVVSLMVIVIMAPNDIAELKTISAKVLVIVLALSIANGMAIYFYAGKAADKNIQTGMFLVTVFILQVAFAPVADWLITGEKPSTLQYAGLGLAGRSCGCSLNVLNCRSEGGNNGRDASRTPTSFPEHARRGDAACAPRLVWARAHQTSRASKGEYQA